MKRNIKKALPIWIFILLLLVSISIIIKSNSKEYQYDKVEEGNMITKNTLRCGLWPICTLGWNHLNEEGTAVTLYGRLSIFCNMRNWKVGFVWDTTYHQSWRDYPHQVWANWYGLFNTFSANVYNLKRTTTYHYRAIGEYKIDGTWHQGMDQTCTPGLPSVSTESAIGITSDSAILNGELLHMGGARKCKVWFAYDYSSHSTNPSQYSFSTDCLTMGSTGEFSLSIMNLKSNTTYYFCAFASNDVGTVYGLEKKFTTLKREHKDNTPPAPPNKPCGPIWGRSNISYSYSTVTTDPDGDKIKYYFDWGDGTGEWTTFTDSGVVVSAFHLWRNMGKYEIKVKARDEYGLESNWSSPLNVTIENIPPNIEIEKPKNGLYIFDKKLISLPCTLIIGSITVQVNAYDNESGISRVEFYIDDMLKFNDLSKPYEWVWHKVAFFRHTIKAIAYDKAGNKASDEIKVWKFF